MRNLFRIIFLVLAFFISSPHSVYAGSDFSSIYDISYAVSPSGKTIVTENISLINKTSGTYPKQYSITLDSSDVKNVIAYDPKGIVPIEVKNQDGKTTLLLTFNSKIVGLDKSLPFSLRFETDSIARKVGSIWEISIPGVPKDEDITAYDVRLSVPDSFGKNSYVSPAPTEGMHWNKDSLLHGGTSAAYGEKQSYNVTLSYHLKNPSAQEKTMTITLPPDTAYQQILIKSLEPEAGKVERDRDGNWLARYSVEPYGKKDIVAEIVATVSPFPRDSYGKDSISSADYLSELPYWEVSSDVIALLSRQYKTPEEIYSYVSSKLTYDYSRVSLGSERLGAVGATRSPDKALCNEFTDLFIALSRASGIPARRVVGFGYTTNPKIKPLSLVFDVLHTWPEYFDEKRSMWISIDPTWANTTGGQDFFHKLDFSHIAFAINGLSSAEPKSPGMYKDENIQSKDVVVTLASDSASSDASSLLSLSFILPKYVMSGTTVKGTFEIKNTSGISSHTDGVKIESTSHLVSLSNSVSEIPPFGSLSIPISYTVPVFGSSSQDILTARVGENTAKIEISYASSLFFILGVLAVISGIVLIFIYIKVFKNR